MRYSKVMRGVSFAANVKGVKSALGVHMVANITYYYGHASVDPELIYQMVKWLGENYSKYKGRHTDNEDMTIEAQRENLDLNQRINYLPVHDGTIRYLKEKGKWTPADAAWNEKNQELLARYIKTYKAAIAAADERNIKVAPDNKEWVELWESFKKDIPSFGVTAR